MKKIACIFFFLALITSLSYAQDSTKVKRKERPSIYWLFHNNYQLATRYNDYAEAKSALYSLINIDQQNDSLRFNLAYLYFDAKQYASTILVCMDILSRSPQHAPSLEMTAISYQELGLKEKALTNYEKLYLITDNIETLYKLTFIQYELKRYGECDVNLGILLANPEIDEKTMIFPLSEFEQKEFPLRAAILNLSGLVKKAQGDKKGAREDFNKALEISPDFVFATSNLEELDK
jgi:tetratricopeptide (TPR) repeat protein